jgi:hypothetical protein
MHACIHLQPPHPPGYPILPLVEVSCQEVGTPSSIRPCCFPVDELVPLMQGPPHASSHASAQRQCIHTRELVLSPAKWQKKHPIPIPAAEWLLHLQFMCPALLLALIVPPWQLTGQQASLPSALSYTCSAASWHSRVQLPHPHLASLHAGPEPFAQ